MLSLPFGSVARQWRPVFSCEPEPKTLPDGGVTQAIDGPGDSADSELYFACSQGGKTRFAWGDTKPAPAERCTGEGCSGAEAPFDQIVGMSDGPASPEERCLPNGGSCYSPAYTDYGHDSERRKGACDFAGVVNAGPYTGIRCCADPL